MAAMRFSNMRRFPLILRNFHVSQDNPQGGRGRCGKLLFVIEVGAAGDRLTPFDTAQGV